MKQNEAIHGELAVLTDRLRTGGPAVVAEAIQRMEQLARKGQAGATYRHLVDALRDISDGATCPDPDGDDVVAWRATVHQLRAIARDVVSLLPEETPWN